MARTVDPMKLRIALKKEYSAEDVKKMAISLYEIGQQRAITVSPAMEVIDGWLRVKAARKLKRGFITIHRGVPRFYKQDLQLFITMSSWAQD